MTSKIKNLILSTLEGGGFQDLCDALLCAEGYKDIFSLGMKAGTLKATTGNPDTYFRSESGKYIFVAYTTEQTSINKLANILSLLVFTRFLMRAKRTNMDTVGFTILSLNKRCRRSKNLL